MGGGSKACLVNVIICALYTNNFELASWFIVRLLECSEAPSETTKTRFLAELGNFYKDEFEWSQFEWWFHLRDICNREEGHGKCLEFISTVFNRESINQLRQLSEKVSPDQDYKDYEAIASTHSIAKPVIKVIKETSDLQTRLPSAEAQIELSNYAKAVLSACKKYFTDTRFWERKPVEKILELLSEISQLTYLSRVKDECALFVKEVETEIPFLAPSQVTIFSEAIQNEIEVFCSKPNETRWSLQLLRNCASSLIEIKTILGVDDTYYKRISTQIADNALYASESEIESAERKQNNPRNDKILASENLRNVLVLATQLSVDIGVLDLEDDFRISKIAHFRERIKNSAERNNFKIGDVKPSISLESHDDIYRSCNDYKSLKDFILSYPNSPHCAEAIKRIWKIEDDEYPKGDSLTIKTLLAYKDKFPSSHNDKKLLDYLDRMLLGKETLGTVYDYRMLLRLWPAHPKKPIVLGRLDLALFKMCRNIEDWNEYLQEFPNGLYRKEALKHIQEEKYKVELEAFNSCQTIKDYCRFLAQYPSGKLYTKAQEKIEDLYFSQAIQTGRFEAYYHQYPSGRYIKALNELADDKCFESCKTTEDYKKYIRLNPQGFHVQEARKKLKKDRQRIIIWVSAIIGIILLFGCVVINYEPNVAIKRAVTNDNLSYNTDTENVPDDNFEDKTVEASYNSYDAYRDNSLETGTKPYASYFGKEQTGENFFYFKTSGITDYVVIVKRHSNGKYVNHIYIRGGDNARLYVPSGTYDVYFYSGNGWNPNMEVGGFTGGFVEDAMVQKDGGVQLTTKTITLDDGSIQSRTQYLEYTLYPVTNGNLVLQSADIDNVLK